MKTAEDILLEKKSKLVFISTHQTIMEALDLMVKYKIGAVLVKKDDEIVGIWTERDFLRNSLKSDFDPHHARVGDHMSSPLHSAPHDATLTTLEEMFLGLFVRHIPVTKEGEYIGMVSIGDALRANLLEKDSRIKELNSMASWQYYENWGWGCKRR
jgi:CBS domain-containing protein